MDIQKGMVEIYVDGSYNGKTNEYGFGVYIIEDGKEYKVCGSGMCSGAPPGRNVEGEVAAATEALKYMLSNSKYKEVVIYHDYLGIGYWADKIWKANKHYTKAYVELVDNIRNKGYIVTFKHIKGHSGVRGNEIADELAKNGCGI